MASTRTPIRACPLSVVTSSPSSGSPRVTENGVPVLRASRPSTSDARRPSCSRSTARARWRGQSIKDASSAADRFVTTKPNGDRDRRPCVRLPRVCRSRRSRRRPSTPTVPFARSPSTGTPAPRCTTQSCSAPTSSAIAQWPGRVISSSSRTGRTSRARRRSTRRSKRRVPPGVAIYPIAIAGPEYTPQPLQQLAALDRRRVLPRVQQRRARRRLLTYRVAVVAHVAGQLSDRCATRRRAQAARDRAGAGRGGAGRAGAGRTGWRGRVSRPVPAAPVELLFGRGHARRRHLDGGDRAPGLSARAPGAEDRLGQAASRPAHLHHARSKAERRAVCVLRLAREGDRAHARRHEAVRLAVDAARPRRPADPGRRVRVHHGGCRIRVRPLLRCGHRLCAASSLWACSRVPRRRSASCT